MLNDFITSVYPSISTISSQDNTKNQKVKYTKNEIKFKVFFSNSVVTKN